jgi:hypothetical protein
MMVKAQEDRQGRDQYHGKSWMHVNVKTAICFSTTGPLKLTHITQNGMTGENCTFARKRGQSQVFHWLEQQPCRWEIGRPMSGTAAMERDEKQKLPKAW